MGQTCQQIADATAVNKSTVSRVVANATTETPATVKGKDGKPTKDDKFSANHWARKTLW
jgi:hypothetical protein